MIGNWWIIYGYDLKTKRRLLFLWSIVAILFISVALRFHHAVADRRFHGDEAYFGAFARRAAVNGDWLLSGALDKPPLTIYLNALGMMFWGVQPQVSGVLDIQVRHAEFAIRITQSFLGILTIAVLIAIIRQLNVTTRSTLIVGLCVACSPLLIAFHASGFTDTLLLLCLSCSVWMALRLQAGWAGVWIGIGFLAKQQALLAIPLILGILWVMVKPHVMSSQFTLSVLLKRGMRFSVGLGFGMLIFVVWDAVRNIQPGVLALAVQHNPVGSWQTEHTLFQRLEVWGQFFNLVFGVVIWAFFGLLIVRFKKLSLNQRRIACLMVAYGVGYVIFHVGLVLNTYDRYVLMLVPCFVVICALGFDQLQGRAVFGVGSGALIVSILGVSLAPYQQPAAVSSFAVYDDLQAVSAFLDAQPTASIIYDHWVGWELSFYLDTWSDKRLAYYPTPEALTAELSLNATTDPRFMVVPQEIDFSAWETALNVENYRVIPVYSGTTLTVVQLTTTE